MTTAAQSPAARLENISKQFLGKKLALDQLTLQCEPGRLLAVLRPEWSRQVHSHRIVVGPVAAGPRGGAGIWRGGTAPESGGQWA